MDQSIEMFNKDRKFLQVFSVVSGILLASLAAYIIYNILSLLAGI